MTRKIVLLLAALLLSATALLARPLPARYSPYQHGHRWFMSVQAGPALLLAENMSSYSAYGKAFDSISWHAALSFGYNFTDAWALRIAGVYGYNAGALPPRDQLFPYRFQAAHVFADMVLDHNALAEYNVPFTFKTYAGLGAAYTFGFSETDHPYIVPDSPNLSPAVRLGAIFEYDYKSGFGWFFDLGVEGFSDWYNGLEPEGFKVDVAFKLSVGFIYHFPLAK